MSRARNLLTENRRTPLGTLYKPQPLPLQIAILFATFAGGPVIGWLTGQILGGVSQNAQLFLYIPPTLVFFFGYALWAARLAALAFRFVGAGILRALWALLIRRKRPERPEDVLPSMEKLEEMMVRGQRAASSFWAVSLPLAAIAGLGAVFVESPSGVVLRAAVASGICVAWGSALSVLARRCFLPFPEEE